MPQRTYVTIKKLYLLQYSKMQEPLSKKILEEYKTVRTGAAKVKRKAGSGEEKSGYHNKF